MKPRLTSLLALAACIAAFLAAPARAGIITNDPSLPPTFPDGFYNSPDSPFATYNGPGFTLVISDIVWQPFDPVNRTPSGPDEIESFNITFNGNVSVNGSPVQPFTSNGAVQTDTFGKIGNTTGTFQTEMLSINLTGTSVLGPFMVRESPTLVSPGQTTVTDVGGGNFQIDSFFDVFTEISVDGGATWMPDSTGPARINLVPEPGTALLTAFGMGGMLLMRRRAKGSAGDGPIIAPRKVA